MTRKWIRLPYVPALVLAVGAATMFPASAAKGSPHTARARFTVTISAIDRDGTPVSGLPLAAVASSNGTVYQARDDTATVPAGTYVVAAPIWRIADGDTETLVAKKVRVTADTNVTLSAVNAVPVSATLSGAGAVTQGSQSLGLCISGPARSGIVSNNITGFTVDSAGTVYVRPMTARGLRMVYQTDWQGADALYNLGELNAGGIPSHPAYHQSISGMAKVSVSVRPSENVTPLMLVEEDYHQCGAMQEPATSLPDTFTNYLTQGEWGTVCYFGTPAGPDQKVIWNYDIFRPGHSYHRVLGAAANGPDLVVPAIRGHAIAFFPGALMNNPGAVFESDSEGKATVSLYRGTALIKQSTLDFDHAFSARPPGNGWYTLDADAQRWNPTGSVPAGILSPRVSVDWRFHFAPVHGRPFSVQETPVPVTTFFPRGLSQQNSGPANGRTTIKFVIQRSGGDPVPTPIYRLKKIEVQASFDDGASWHVLTATKHGGYWLVTVRNPATGYVSLRSIVTDVHGDSAIETIYRAYAVGAP